MRSPSTPFFARWERRAAELGIPWFPPVAEFVVGAKGYWWVLGCPLCHESWTIEEHPLLLALTQEAMLLECFNVHDCPETAVYEAAEAEPEKNDLDAVLERARMTYFDTISMSSSRDWDPESSVSKAVRAAALVAYEAGRDQDFIDAIARSIVVENSKAIRQRDRLLEVTRGVASSLREGAARSDCAERLRAAVAEVDGL